MNCVVVTKKYAFGFAEYNRQTSRYDVDTSEQWYGEPMVLEVDAEQPLDDQLDDLIDYVRSMLGKNVQAYCVCGEDEETYRIPESEENVVVQGYGKVVDQESFETRDLCGEIDLPADADDGDVYYFVFSDGEEEDDILEWGVFYPLR